MPEKLRIVFFGTPEFSVPFFDAVASDAAFEVVAAVSQPDKESGRGHALQPTPIKVAAQARGIPVLQPPTLKTPEAVETLAALKADAYVVVAYGKIIPQAVLDLPRLGCVNVHPSLLPRYRGPSPMQAAIKNGDADTGVTIMRLDAGMDTGPILAFVTLGLNDDETATTLAAAVQEQGAPLLVDTLKRYAAGEIIPMPQDDARATVVKLLDREDGRIDWTQTLAEIERTVRAYEGWPGTWTEWNGARLKVLAASPADFKADLPPGTVTISAGGGSASGGKNSRLYVDCSDGTLELTRVQPEGKPPMDAAAFARGYSAIDGAALS